MIKDTNYIQNHQCGCNRVYRNKNMTLSSVAREMWLLATDVVEVVSCSDILLYPCEGALLHVIKTTY